MIYQVVTPKAIQKKITALPPEVADRLDEAILALAEDPRPDGVVKMKGKKQTYRIRVGDYRIIKATIAESKVFKISDLKRDVCQPSLLGFLVG
jgi:mRNA interferase RelE/StbE